MRTSEVEVNTQVSFKANDAEYHEFKMRCLENRREVSEVLREYIREVLKRGFSK